MEYKLSDGSTLYLNERTGDWAIKYHEYAMPVIITEREAKELIKEYYDVDLEHEIKINGNSFYTSKY